MKRIFDLLLAVILLIALAPLMLIVLIMVILTSKGAAVHWSDRFGKNNIIFKMPKFRTMVINTPHLATNLLNNPQSYLTPIGGFLRSTSLDELPQLFSIILGDMSFLGPRPALHNQFDLIALRTSKGLHQFRPGITGLAQVSGRDGLALVDKVAFEIVHMNKQSVWFDLKILMTTIVKVVKKVGVSH